MKRLLADKTLALWAPRSLPASAERPQDCVDTVAGVLLSAMSFGWCPTLHACEVSRNGVNAAGSLRLDPGRPQDRQQPHFLAIAERLDLGGRGRPGRCTKFGVPRF